MYKGGVLHLGMAMLLQVLAALVLSKGVGTDQVAIEALESLDLHTQLMVVAPFEKRLGCEDALAHRLDAWFDFVP